MTQGIVKWFNSVKGFGFVTQQDGNGGDIFVHYSQIQTEGYRNLKEGQPIEFDLVDTDKGPCAHNVRIA
jgi:CspA family cold shock protein